MHAWAAWRARTRTGRTHLGPRPPKTTMTPPAMVAEWQRRADGHPLDAARPLRASPRPAQRASHAGARLWGSAMAGEARRVAGVQSNLSIAFYRAARGGSRPARGGVRGESTRPTDARRPVSQSERKQRRSDWRVRGPRPSARRIRMQAHTNLLELTPPALSPSSFQLINPRGGSPSKGTPASTALAQAFDVPPPVLSLRAWFGGGVGRSPLNFLNRTPAVVQCRSWTQLRGREGMICAVWRACGVTGVYD